MPTSYVLAPSDLICVPVTPPVQQPMAQPPQPALGPVAPVRAQWAPAKAAPKPKPALQPPPPKPKPRSRALVDFINNFKIDCADLQPQEPPRPPVQQQPPPQQKPQPRPVPQQRLPLQQGPAPVKPSDFVRMTRPAQPLRPTLCYLPPNRAASAVRPRAAPPTPRAPPAPVPRPPPPCGALSISMPSLDDSPPTSCDNSPVFRSTPHQALPALSPVHTFSPPHQLRPHPSPPPVHSPSFYPPSPFLSPRAPPQTTSPLHCVPSFTPPLPPPYVPPYSPLATHPPLSPKTPLPSTCDPLPPIGCTVSPLRLDPPRLPPSVTSRSSPVTPPVPCIPPVPSVTPPVHSPTPAPSSPPKPPPPTPPKSGPPATPPSPLTLQPPRLPPQLALQQANENRKCVKELKITPRRVEPESPQLVYDVVADDGFKFSSTSLADVWQKICESVQEVRAAYRMPELHMASRSFEVPILFY